MRLYLPRSRTLSSISLVTNATARISRISEELKLISSTRLKISAAVLGNFLRSIGLMWTRITSLEPAVVDQGKDGGIAHESAVPIVLAIDLDGVEEVRQASRRKNHVDRHGIILEHLDLAGADIGGGKE